MIEAIIGAIIASIGTLLIVRWQISRRQQVEVTNPVLKVEPAEAALQDLPMDLGTFNAGVLPRQKQEGWEIKLPRPERLYTFQQEGWGEVIITDVQGRQRRVVIVAPGTAEIDLVPIQRREPGYGLSENAKRLLVETARHVEGRHPHSFLFKKSPPHLGIGSVSIDGPEARYVLDELIGRGLVQSASGAVYRLTGAGRDLAQILSNVVK